MNGNYKRKTGRIFVILFIGLLYVNTAYCSIKSDSSKFINFDTAYNTKAGDQVLAAIGKKQITVREFLTSYEFGPSFTKRKKHSKRLYLRFMINEKLLALYGYSLDIDTTQEVKNLLGAISGDIASDAMFMNKIFNKIKVPKAELDSALRENQITYEIKWLYAPNIDSLKFFRLKLAAGISFGTLFTEQLKRDSVFSDQRSMKIGKFKLSSRNPVLSKVVDTLKAGEISKPVKAPDGYYIVKLVDVWKNEILTQTMKEKELHDSRLVIKRDKSDKLSDVYVQRLMLKYNPVIKGRAFDLLKAYIGSYVLTKKKYADWKLSARLKSELNHFSKKNIKDIKLISLSNGELTLDDFINWYKVRENYLQFNKKNFNTFSASLGKMIWQMVRDHLLIHQAYNEGYLNRKLVKEQIGWWKDKIVYAVVRDRLAHSVGLNIESPHYLQSKYTNKRHKLLAKVLHKVLALREKYKIKINYRLLNRIEVQTKDDPQAVFFYIVKEGGTYPHPAYPSIDLSWQRWE
ncbi:MAG TPA: hypothetical protein ENI76_09425 [Ignavibacteria bacterium]|nr:hypothetical protein [Ignavibacteria bacterium]